MRSDRYIKTTLVALASTAVAVAASSLPAAPAWADPPAIAQTEVGSAAGAGATVAVRPNPDEQTFAPTGPTTPRPSATTSIARSNPAEHPAAVAAKFVPGTTPSDRFDWGDAAVGVAIGVALSMLSIGSLTARWRRRARPRGTALSS